MARAGAFRHQRQGLPTALGRVPGEGIRRRGPGKPEPRKAFWFGMALHATLYTPLDAAGKPSKFPKRKGNVLEAIAPRLEAIAGRLFSVIPP